ncbi:MAG: rRNA maturation RNase YbeY [Bdellovibrionales bacterium]|jgi:probable rRNA maturation factor|nr:rRNA maturation RNase YbeY [Bdellovibrionales bacterium]
MIRKKAKPAARKAVKKPLRKPLKKTQAQTADAKSSTPKNSAPKNTVKKITVKKEALRKPVPKKPSRKAPPVFVQMETASGKWTRAFYAMNSRIERAAIAAFEGAKKPAALARRQFEISVTLTDDADVRGLNRDFRGIDKPTNVLSFPQIDLENFKKSSLDVFPADMPIPLGDVVLGYQTIMRETREQKKTIENHTVHLIVHGVLHLLGYDHMRPKDAKVMEKLECDILHSLGYPDPYQDMDLLTPDDTTAKYSPKNERK